MDLKSFRGGMHPQYSKSFTEKVALERAKEPMVVIIPLQQHIGAPCEPIVKAGDTVKVGQKIGEASGFVSAPVHSSISGTVKKIDTVETPSGKTLSVIIESDGNNEIHESVVSKGSLEKLTSQEIVSIVKEAGITGLGGASFPTHVKLVPPPEKNVDTIVLNGAECEPYLTADHRLMLEDPESVIFGLKALMKAVGVEKGYIGVEDNKKDAIQALKEASSNESNIEIVELETKYPQGDEKRLIDATTGRKVPVGGLPMDVGVVVNNVGTAAAIATAIQTGMPLIERIVTITGDAIETPRNLIVKIGTPFKEIIEECGGYKTTPGKIIMGGPMMGAAQFTDEIPVIKGTSGILVLSEEKSKTPEAGQCIRCGKCVGVCPVYLQPIAIRNLSIKERHEETELLNVLSCIECGSCSFICPAKIPLLQSIKVSKQDVLAKRRNK